MPLVEIGSQINTFIKRSAESKGGSQTGQTMMTAAYDLRFTIYDLRFASGVRAAERSCLSHLGLLLFKPTLRLLSTRKSQVVNRKSPSLTLTSISLRLLSACQSQDFFV